MMNQIRAELLKLKYSNVLTMLLVLFGMGLALYTVFGISDGGTQVFISEGNEERNPAVQGIIGFLAFTFKNIKYPQFNEIVKSVMSCNVFLWVFMLIFVVCFFNYDYNMGTIKLPVAYGISRNMIFLAKVIVIVLCFGILYILFSAITLLYTCIKVNYIPGMGEIFTYIGYTMLNYMVMVSFSMICIFVSICLKNTGIIATVICLFTLAGAIIYTGTWQQFHSTPLQYIIRLTPLYYWMNMGTLRLGYGIIHEILIYFCFGIFLIPVSAVLINRQELK